MHGEVTGAVDSTIDSVEKASRRGGRRVWRIYFTGNTIHEYTRGGATSPTEISGKRETHRASAREESAEGRKGELALN